MQGSFLAIRCDHFSVPHLRKFLLVFIVRPKLASSMSHQWSSNGTTLKQEALALGCLTEEQFDQLARPEDMLGPKLNDLNPEA